MVGSSGGGGWGRDPGATSAASIRTAGDFPSLELGWVPAGALERLLQTHSQRPSQPVPPGLGSYKHQPVLRGASAEHPPSVPDGEETFLRSKH